MKADPKWTDNFDYGLTIYMNWKGSYQLQLGSKTDPVIWTETLIMDLIQLRILNDDQLEISDHDQLEIRVMPVITHMG